MTGELNRLEMQETVRAVESESDEIINELSVLVAGQTHQNRATAECGVKERDQGVVCHFGIVQQRLMCT